MVYSLPDVLER